MDIGPHFVATPSRRLDNVRLLEYRGLESKPVATATQVVEGLGWLGALVGMDQDERLTYELKSRDGEALLRAVTEYGDSKSPSRTVVEAPPGTPFGSLVVTADSGLVFELAGGGRVGMLRKAEGELIGGAVFHVVDEAGAVVAAVIEGTPRTTSTMSLLDYVFNLDVYASTPTLPSFGVNRLQVDMTAALPEPLATFVVALPIAVCLGYHRFTATG